MGTEPMYSNAFALSGRTLSLYIHPGRCPGLCACWAFSPLLERLLSIGGQPFPSKHIARRAPIPATSVQGPPRRSTGVQGPPRRSTGGQGVPRRSTGVQVTPRRGNERSRRGPKGQQAVEAGPAFHGIRAFRALSPKKIAFSAKKTSESLLGKKKVVLLHPHSGCSSVRLEYASGGRVVAGSNPVIPT